MISLNCAPIKESRHSPPSKSTHRSQSQPLTLPYSFQLIQEDITIDKIQKVASKYLHSNIIEIGALNIQTFLGENPSVPKVLLFTDKKGVPSVYKGLSVAFEKKLTFGIVRNTEESLTSKYMIKKFPSLIVIKTG